ncbi:GNAT family N-acetyltransferase [Candidatus Nomurabacteria bacterium]|nr:GNAT family N-acetyltransferase [Candidatus Nomurabacteria bacterium]
MFGSVMEFSVEQCDEDPIEVRMAALRREDMPEFILNGGMQSRVVNRYLGRQTAPVLEDEYDWFDKQRNAADQIGWGIYVKVGDTWQVIGNSGFNNVATNTMFRRATSGFLIFRPEYWGKRIASHCHRARTMYAFDELGISCIYSGVFGPNQGSAKALEQVGYVQTGVNRNEGMHQGQFLHHMHYECINPADWAWNAWWWDGSPGQKWLEARERTQAALEWARANVIYV